MMWNFPCLRRNVPKTKEERKAQKKVQPKDVDGKWLEQALFTCVKKVYKCECTPDPVTNFITNCVCDVAKKKFMKKSLVAYEPHKWWETPTQQAMHYHVAMLLSNQLAHKQVAHHMKNTFGVSGWMSFGKETFEGFVGYLAQENPPHKYKWDLCPRKDMVTYNCTVEEALRDPSARKDQKTRKATTFRQPSVLCDFLLHYKISTGDQLMKKATALRRAGDSSLFDFVVSRMSLKRDNFFEN